MNTLTVPYIRYGRFTSENMGGNDQYGVLDFSPDFPDEARSLLERRIVQSFQWTNGSADVYPDSFLFWRLDTDRFLFARLSDGGKDSRNRPHSVRILAVLLKNTDFERFPEDLAALANSSAWSEPSEGQLTLTPVMPENPRLTERLKSALTSGKTTCLILRHPFVQKSEEVLGIDDYSLETYPMSASSPIPTYRPTNTSPLQNHSISKENTMNKYIVYLLLFLLMLSVGNNFLLSWKFAVVSRNIDAVTEAVKASETTLKTNLGSLDERIQTLEKQHEDYVTKGDFEVLQKKIDNVTNNQIMKENFKAEIENLQNVIAAISTNVETMKNSLPSSRNTSDKGRVNIPKSKVQSPKSQDTDS